MPILLFIAALFVSPSSWAYPEFIGYKYSSCLTCHYNGHGNGPINDYGRALWASEIAGRALAGKKNDEQLGESSGFLGSVQMPWWFRPGLKARNIAVRPSPGGPGETRFILMQAEVNAALFFDKDQKYAFVGSWGHAPIPNRLVNTREAEEIDEWISREHYFRWMASESLWMYFGLTDKVYGLRIANHTAFSRQLTGLAMNDQAHGIVAHYIKPSYEFTVNVFAGNMFQDAELRQQGLSTMYEFDMNESWRVGGSALYSTNEFVSMRRLGMHSKTGLGHGSAILFELGLLQNAPKSGGKAPLGYYFFSEAIQRVVRGYHVFVSGQSYKDRMEQGRPDQMRFSFGTLIFPMQRLEFRIEFENSRSTNDSAEVTKDGWAGMAQIHLSL